MVPFWATNNPNALQTGKTFLHNIRDVTMLSIGQEVYVSDHEALVHFAETSSIMSINLKVIERIVYR